MLRRLAYTYKSSFGGLSRETWLLSMVMMLNRFGTMAVPFMGLYITQSLKRSEVEAGLIITLFGCGSILGTIAGGKLTDLVGFRPVQIFPSIIAGCMFIVFPAVTDFPALCVLTVVISFFADAFRPANFTAIASYAKAGTTTRSYSLNRLATNIGWSIGISIAGIIASFNYKMLFVVEGGVYILVGLSIWLFLPKTQVNRTDRGGAVKEGSGKKPWQDVFYVKFILMTTAFVTCVFIMFRVVPVFFKEQWQLSESVIGVILGLNGLLIAIFEMVLINRLEHRRPSLFYITIGTVFFAFAYLLLSLPVTFYLALALLSITVFTFGEMLVLPFINTMVISRSTPENRGLYSAGYTLSWSVAQVSGPFAGFYIAKHAGYLWLWVGIFFVLLLCAYGYGRLKVRD
ncbi:MFS transporter [Pedobacter deserti]|uniref:MFS transporter n=1 Tax=Pedobacter deserti TaxID=2817382 RepID=UPI00210C9B69|nr:MFS transporter [Pedobacter sp. SYSU D00382]